MSLNFPTSNLQVGDTYNGPNGVTYTYDGAKWIGSRAASTTLINDDKVVQVDQFGNLVIPSGGQIVDQSGSSVLITGATGPRGATGPTGAIGATGERGSDGSTGVQGLTGATGPTGAQGVSVTLQGTKATIGDLPAAPVNPNDFAGHGWIVTTGDGLTHQDGSLWFWNLSEGAWNDVGPIVGPQGDAGPQGYAGASGIDGATGFEGATGATGPQGFEGPQGATGFEGPMGATGPDGQMGATGFEGATGVQGATGADGPIGATGVQGDIGATGVGFTWRGSWDGSYYVPNDVVQYNGTSYICVVDNFDTLPTDTIYWQIVAQKGDTGLQGPAGADGAPGTSLTGWTVDSFNALVPNTDNLQDIGTPSLRVRHVYVGPGSITVGNSVITESNTGKLVLPGLTRGTGFNIEEVEDEDDQTYSFNSVPLIIDNAHFAILNGATRPGGYVPPEYSVDQLDGDGYIDGISITNQGSGLTQTEANLMRSNMWAYVGSDQDPIGNWNSGDWIAIPFTVRTKANDVEYEFGGTDLGDFSIDGSTLESEQMTIKTNDGDLIIESDSDVVIRASGTNKQWQFNTSGNLELPEGGDIVDSLGQSVLGGGTADLGDLKIGYSTLGTQGENGVGWGYHNLYLDPGGESNAYITIPSVPNQSNGQELTIWNTGSSNSNIRLYARNAVQITVNDGQGGGDKIFEFGNDGSLTFPDGSIQTTAYIGQEISASVPRQATAPTSANGQLWFNTEDGRMYIKYMDQWIDASPVVVPPITSLTLGDAVLTVVDGQLLVDGVAIGSDSATHIEYTDTTTNYTSTVDLTYDFKVDVDKAHLDINGNGFWEIGSSHYSTKIFSTDELDPDPLDVVIRADNNDWKFRRTGIIATPNGGMIGGVENTDGIDLYASSSMQWAQLNWNTENFVYVDDQGAHLQAGPAGQGPGQYEVVLGTDGNTTLPGALIFPDNSIQTTAYTGGGGSGSVGATGATGPAGPAGNQGATGAAGADGLPGSPGIDGAPGDQGATGVQGDIGATGAQGANGATGLTGATGIQGATGPQGPAGATGAVSTSTLVSQAVSATTAISLLNGGYTLRPVAVPSNLAGAAGDTVGDIANDGSYLYYCSVSSTQTNYIGYTYGGASGAKFVSIVKSTYEGPSAPVAGMIVTHRGVSHTITSVTDQSTYWQLNYNTSESASDWGNGETVTVTTAPAVGNIWKTVPWNAITTSTTSTVSITNTTSSTSTTTGALRVTGGAGVGGNAYVGGYVVQQALPAFRVVGNGGSVSTGTTLTSAHWVMDYNQGNHLNTSTGIFTAPITGIYQINLVMRTASNVNPTINQAIIVKNTSTTLSMLEYGINTTMNHAGVSTAARLVAGDQVKVNVAVGTMSFDGNDNWSIAFLG